MMFLGRYLVLRVGGLCPSGLEYQQKWGLQWWLLIAVDSPATSSILFFLARFCISYKFEYLALDKKKVKKYYKINSFS